MREHTHLISVDWGTSRLRIRLVDTATSHIVQEIQTEQGIKAMYNDWTKVKADRIPYYLDYIANQLEEFTPVRKATPVIISGMASSSIGMKELPYKELPFSCTGSGLFVETFEYDKLGKVFLISGVRAARDVIRGEETEFLGVYQSSSTSGKSCYIFPGTHSKHMICQNDQVVDFHTFMTGELFDVVCKNTILKTSIELEDRPVTNEKVFASGVQDSQSHNILNSLFKIRADHILHDKNKKDNADYLSGLLIGHELTHLRSMQLEEIKLCAQNKLGRLYSLAASQLGIALQPIASDILEKATVRGHLILLKL